MGGRPLMALTVYVLPEDFPLDVGRKILLGGSRAALAAGAPVVGGHTVQGRDLMFGLAVIGEVHPERLFSNSALPAGDALLLTKPLGTGTLATGVKRGSLRRGGDPRGHRRHAADQRCCRRRRCTLQACAPRPT